MNEPDVNEFRKAFGLPLLEEDNRTDVEKALGIPAAPKPPKDEHEAFIQALGVHNKNNTQKGE